jgi:hypothetical protein
MIFFLYFQLTTFLNDITYGYILKKLPSAYKYRRDIISTHRKDAKPGSVQLPSAYNNRTFSYTVPMCGDATPSRLTRRQRRMAGKVTRRCLNWHGATI